MSSSSAVENELVVEQGSGVRASTWLKPRAEVLAVISILLGAAGQLVVKEGLLRLSANHAAPGMAARLAWPAAVVLLGLSVYAVGTWFWLKAVSRAAISYLYPLSAGSYAVVALGGQFFFGESIGSGRWLGIAVITLGVALMTFTSNRSKE